MMDKTSSPKPPKKEQYKMDFKDALIEVLVGKSITKLEWGDKQYHGLLKDEKLMLHKPDGKYYDWIISEGDMRSDDWITL